MRKPFVAVLSFVLAICLVLAGCGGAGSNSKENYVGRWIMVGLADEANGEYSSEDIDLMHEMGLDVIFELEEDGNAHLSMFGAMLAGTWELTDGGSAVFSFEDQEANLSLSGEQLIFKQDGTTMTFAPLAEEPTEAEDEPAATEESSSEDTADEPSEDAEATEQTEEPSEQAEESPEQAEETADEAA